MGSMVAVRSAYPLVKLGSEMVSSVPLERAVVQQQKSNNQLQSVLLRKVLGQTQERFLPLKNT